jgi:hypothetical protein
VIEERSPLLSAAINSSRSAVSSTYSLLPQLSRTHNNTSIHTTSTHSHLLHSNTFTTFTSNSNLHPKCLPKPQQKRSPLPRHLLPRLPPRRRKLERRPPPLVRRRREPRRARRPTLHTFTKVCSRFPSRVISKTICRVQHCDASTNRLRISTSGRVFHHKHLTFSILVLKQVHPDTGISNRAMSILNSFVNGMHIRLFKYQASLTRFPDIFERVATEASKLAAYNKKSTISSREIQTS